MKNIFQFIFILLNLSIALGQTNKTQWNELEIADMSVLLYRKINDSISKTGTATIINKETQYYIITAEHVAKDIDNKSQIVFHLPNDKPLIVDLTEFTTNKEVNWINHEIADISILKIKLPLNINLREKIIMNSFPINHINNGKELPNRNADITFYGYPVIDLELDHFSALNISSKICSGLITQKRADNFKNCNFFYLDKPSIQGCSGSGVYYSVAKTVGMTIGDDKTILIGIMHGTRSDNTGGKLAMITPSYYLFDILK